MVNFFTSAPAGGMVDRTWITGSVATTDANYTEIAVVNIPKFAGFYHSFYVTGDAALMKIEITRDGVNYVTLVEDFPCAKGATTSFTHVTLGVYMRVSIKRAGAVDISCNWGLIATAGLIPAEYRYAFAYEAQTVTNAKAVTLTQATYLDAFTALITVEDNPIRIRIDGTAPTTTEGHLLQAGESMVVNFSTDIFRFQAIATGGNAKIKVTYSR